MLRPPPAPPGGQTLHWLTQDGKNGVRIDDQVTGLDNINLDDPITHATNE